VRPCPRPALSAKLKHKRLRLTQVNEIDKAIDAAERNPQRFKLSQAEISDRRRWVISTRRQVEATTGGLASAADSAAADAPAARLAAAAHEDNDRFIASEGSRQQALIARQDAELDHLSTHVVRIGQLGREMGQELDLQGQLLSDLDADMDGTQMRLATAQRKIQHVLDKAGTKGQLMIIAGLLVVLVVLLFIVLS
jgi:syntaxin of plants SYP6